MKTIVVSDKRAADLVAAGDAEYASGNEHVTAPLPEHVVATLPPVKTMAVNGQRVDLPCPQGTPGTVTLAQTNHTLSLANPSGEGFPGYCQRVAQQAMGDPNIVGELFQGGDIWFAPFGGFKSDGSNWPQAADRFFDIRANRTAYMSPEERATDDKARAGWASVGERMQEQQQGIPMPTRSEPQELSPAPQPDGGEQMLQPSQT